MKKPLLPRSKFLINRQVQMDLIFHVCVFVMSLFAVQVIGAYFVLGKIKTVAGAGGFDDFSVLEFIERYQTLFLITQFIPVVVFLFFGIWYFGKMTRRIVGPLYNIKKNLRRMRDENLDTMEIRLRSDDYFHDLAEEINISISRKPN